MFILLHYCVTDYLLHVFVVVVYYRKNGPLAKVFALVQKKTLKLKTIIVRAGIEPETFRLHGMGGKRPAATQVEEFTAGVEAGMGIRSGKLHR